MNLVRLLIVLFCSLPMFSIAQDSTSSYKVMPIQGLNSKGNDFCPVMHKGKVIFTSSRAVDHVSSHRTPEGAGFTKLFTAKLKYVYGIIDASTRPVMATATFLSDRHDGPACFSPDGKTVWFTREMPMSEKSKRSVLAIYTSEWRNENWTKPVAVPFNDRSYSSAHPAMSVDGKVLWFSSNRPGSVGGMDLWYCEKKRNSWGSAVNAGKMINSTENDVFPSFYDMELYFSSKGHGSSGGYDIFRVRDTDDPMVERLTQPINSVNDDFGICFISSRHGLFTSNRPDGEGGDDIYSFLVTRADEELVSIIGKLKKQGVPLPGVKLGLKEEKSDQLIMQTTTDKEGVFRFDGLLKNERYLIEVDEGDAIDILNEQGDAIGAMINGPRGFAFTALPFDEMDQLSLIDEGDPNLLSLEIDGQVFKKVPGDVRITMNVQILDDLGRIHHTTTTGDSGKFTFQRVPLSDDYRIRLDPTPEDAMIRIYDPKGPVDILPEQWTDLFSYERLDWDEHYITIIDENGVEMHIRVDENYRIPMAYYELDKWELNDKGKEELKRVATLLLINEHIKAELSSHTDSRGTTQHNQELSEKRAGSSVDYLKLLGVPEDAIVAKGFGESQLISNCTDNVPCTEQEYARDRRTELRFTLR